MNKEFDAERVSAMEAEFDRALKALKELRLALEAFSDAKEAFAVLSDYFHSPQWLEDYDSAVAPYQCKCGVLSQDGLYNLFSERRELLRLMADFSEKGGNLS